MTASAPARRAATVPGPGPEGTLLAGLRCHWCKQDVTVIIGAGDAAGTGMVMSCLHRSNGSEECADGQHLALIDLSALCQHVPDPRTAYTRTGLEADLQRQGDYPAEAQCRRCAAWIQAAEYKGERTPWQLKYPDRPA